MKSTLIASLLLITLLSPQVRACTAFAVYRNGLALAGNNEDYWVTDTKIWFVPREGSKRGESGQFGRVYFGFSNFFPQGGMNESGLFFDGFATRANEIKKSIDRPHFEGNLIDHAMATCQNVEEVVNLFQGHNLSFLANAMLMFSDKDGDSVIIEGDEFLRIKGDHQIVTNFYQSLTEEEACPCARYKTAQKALGKGDPISIASCRDILAATRQDGKAKTQYSNVYDLKNGIVHLYHYFNFAEVVSLDLSEELKKGAHEIDLPSLFPKNEKFLAFQELRKNELHEQIEIRRSRDVDPGSYQAYIGTYSLDVKQARKLQVEIAVEDRRLYARNKEEQERQEIFPEGDDRFFYINDFGAWTYEFQRDRGKNITGITVALKELGREFHGEKVK